MSDAIAVRVAAHRNNIERYRRLLRTQLTDHERRWLLARLEEEKSELRRLGYSPTMVKTQPRARAQRMYRSVPPHVAAVVMGRGENSGGGPLHAG